MESDGALLFSLNGDHKPCHDEDYASSEGRPKIGFNAFNPDFAQDRDQAGEDGRGKGIEEPTLSPLEVTSPFGFCTIQYVPSAMIKMDTAWTHRRARLESAQPEES